MQQGIVKGDCYFYVLDKNDLLLPDQIRKTAYRPDGSLKWVLVIMTAPQTAESREQYTLEIRKDSGPSPKGRINVRESDLEIHVNTGAIEFAINRGASDLFKETADFLIREREYRKWYSFLDYGDMVHSYDLKRDIWRRDEGGYAWNNNEHCTCEGLWTAYMHSGDARLFRLAEAMTRHLGDVDMYHMGPIMGNDPGSEIRQDVQEHR